MRTKTAENHERFHALKEAGRGFENFAKGAAATVAAGGMLAGEALLGIKAVPTLLFEPLPNYWSHMINGLEWTGLTFSVIGVAAATYIMLPYGIDKIREGIDDLRQIRR